MSSWMRKSGPAVLYTPWITFELDLMDIWTQIKMKQEEAKLRSSYFYVCRWVRTDEQGSWRQRLLLTRLLNSSLSISPAMNHWPFMTSQSAVCLSISIPISISHWEFLSSRTGGKMLDRCWTKTSRNTETHSCSIYEPPICLCILGSLPS